MIVAGHLPRETFSFRESGLDDDDDDDNDAEWASKPSRNSEAHASKSAYRKVEDAIDRLLLSMGVEHVDVLHVPWPAFASDAFRGSRRYRRLVRFDAREKVEVSAHRHENITACDALSFSFDRDSNVFIPERMASKYFDADARAASAAAAETRRARRRALSSAVRDGKVRRICASFQSPWDACALELGEVAFRDDAEDSLASVIGSASCALSGLRDPRRSNRPDDYEATLERWCAPGKGARPLVARGAFWERDASLSNDAVLRFETGAGSAGRAMLEAASRHGEFTEEDVALFLVRSRGFVAAVSLGSNAVSSPNSNAPMDDETFDRRLAAFGRGAGPQDGEMLASLQRARLKHFEGASNAERGMGKGRGRGRDPFEELREGAEDAEGGRRARDRRGFTTRGTGTGWK